MAKRPTVGRGVETLTRRQLAATLGVHMQTVTKWEHEGLPVEARGRKGKPSTYNEAAVRAWLQAREEAVQSGAGLDLVQERARKERWQGLLAEQTYHVRARKLLPSDDVEQQLAARVNATRTKLLSWQTTLSDAVFRAATLQGLPGVEAALKAAVYEVLHELAALPTPPAATESKKRRRKDHAA